jgi:hypothetical protein
MKRETPQFPMETNKPVVDVSMKELVGRLVDKVLDESCILKETSKNRISVGGARSVSVKSLYWQPHHLRLYFDFNKVFFNASKPMLEVGCRYVNGTELEFPDFLDHRIVIKKSQIELTNKVDHKKWYVITLDSTTRAQQFEVYLKKVEESLSVLRELIKRYGGVSQFKLLNFRCQDKIANEDVVNKLPLKSAFYGELMQKVYNESNIESKDEPMAAINYIENAALRSVTPIIAKRLDAIDLKLVGEGSMLITHNPTLFPSSTLIFLKSNVKDINDIFIHKDKVELLSDKEKELFSEWTFEGLRT